MELAIFIILIRLINVVQQTVHIGLSKQGEMTRPPWLSCFNPSHDAGAWERGWKSFAAGAKAVDESPSSGLQMPSEDMGGAELPDAPELHEATQAACSLCIP